MKSIKYITLILSVVLSQALSAQNVKKALLQLKSKNSENAAKILLKSESENTKNIEVVYGLSILYSDNNKYQNPTKAAYYFKELKNRHLNLSAKERKNLEHDFSINNESIKKLSMQVAKSSYPYFAKEGDLNSLMQFYEIFPDYSPEKTMAERDWELARDAQKLKLEKGYIPQMEKEYLKFIKKAAPRDIAFRALLTYIQPYLQKKEWKKSIKLLMELKSEFPAPDKRIEKIITTLKENSEEIKIKSISSLVNSSGFNYAPVLSPDNKKLYFCGRYRTDNMGNEDIFETEFINNEWIKPVLLNGINTKSNNEAPLSVSPDDRILITYKKGDLWYSLKNSNNKWSAPKQIQNIDTKEYMETDACFSSDGKALFFASDRKGNYGTFHPVEKIFNGNTQGNMDIYVSLKINDSTWSNPINIGKNINTNLCERSPFFHSDGKTLYFSSESHGSIGGLDVFKTTRLSDTSWTLWSEPENLGKTINTVKDDTDYKFSADGNTAYFSFNDSDKVIIASFEIPKKQKIIPLCNLIVEVTDSISKLPLFANINVENLSDNQRIDIEFSNNSGKYGYKLPSGKLIALLVNMPGYLPVSLSVNTDTFDIYKRIQLVPVSTFAKQLGDVKKKPVTITLNNIFFEYNLYNLTPESYPELDQLVAFLKLYPDISIEISGHTDDKGDADYNKTLSENRAVSVKNYLVENGCKEENLKAVGYGEERPITTNVTNEGRQKNRRVELNISSNGFSENKE